jgi:hypothetical protein
MAVKKLVNESSEPMKSSKVVPMNVPPPTTPPPVTSSAQPQSKMGFLQKIQALLLHPFQFMTYMQQESGFVPAMLLWAEVAAITYLVGSILSLVLNYDVGSIISFVLSLLMIPVSIFVFGIPVMFLIGLLLHGFLKLFHGQGTFSDTMRAYFYAGIPASILSIIITLASTVATSSTSMTASPSIILMISASVGWLFIIVYGLVIEAWFFAAVHRISKMAAGGAVALTGVVVTSIAFGIAFLFALLIGFSLFQMGGSDVLDGLIGRSTTSSSETSYMDAINKIDTQRTNALDKISNLETKLPDEWTTEEKQQFQQSLLSLDGLQAILNATSIPDSFSAVNDQFLEALGGYRVANEQFRIALAANDAAAITEAVITFARADELYVHAHQVFAALVSEQVNNGASSTQKGILRGLTPRSI